MFNFRLSDTEFIIHVSPGKKLAVFRATPVVYTIVLSCTMYTMYTSDQQRVSSYVQSVFDSANIPGILPKHTQTQLTCNQEYNSHNLVYDLRQSTAINRSKSRFKVQRGIMNSFICKCVQIRFSSKLRTVKLQL